MSTTTEPKAVKAWHKGGLIWVRLDDGRTVSFPADANERLRTATHAQRNRIEISPFGLHWPAVDEDLSLGGILADRYDRPRRGGARAGAGRKPSGHVRMQIIVSPLTRQRIEQLARRRHLTLSAAVERMAEAVGN